MQTVKLLVTLTLDEGRVDAPYLMSSVDHAINKMRSESGLSPDDEDHATVTGFTTELVA